MLFSRLVILCVFLSPLTLSDACSPHVTSDTPASVPEGNDEHPSQKTMGHAGPKPASIEPTIPVSRPIASPVPTGQPWTSISEKMPFIARLKTPLAVTSMTVSAHVNIIDNCLVADFGSHGRATLVLPPRALIEGSRSNPTAIIINRDRIKLGFDQILPGGSANVSVDDLIMPIPNNCPDNLFVIGG